MTGYVHSDDALGTIEAPADAVFDFLDEQANLSSHMSRTSWMMLGTSMHMHTDDQLARSVGSRFGFAGSILGLPLGVEEVVTTRQPPSRKVWQTVREPRLWVIGRYEMGFEITPGSGQSMLRVYIRYDRPARGFARLLGLFFGAAYARWCTHRMVADARRHFLRQRVSQARPREAVARDHGPRAERSAK